MIASTDSERMAPRQMGILAERIEEVVKTLSGWGIRVSSAGRLHEAMRLLRRMSKAGRFPDDRTELKSLAHAMRDAQEFTEIADVLPENRLHPVATDLQRAMGGVLGGAGHEAVQYQTQLWFGACLVHAGASVAVPLDSSRPNADFVIQEGNTRYPAEVKRPKTLGAQRLVSDAVGQIRTTGGHGGVIMVDVTDCLDPALAIRFGSGPLDLAEPKAVIEECATALDRQIFDGAKRRLRPNREKVFVLYVFGRHVYWDLDDLSTVHLMRSVISTSYWRGSPKTLRGHRAAWLAQLVDRGIKAVGHQEFTPRWSK